MKSSSSIKYDAISRAFHWITALAVIVTFVLGPERFGRLMRDGVDPATRLDIVWHESLGIFVFFATLLRLLWVLLRPAGPKFDMATWMKRASQGTHIVLWALLLATPFTAVMALGTESHPLTLLGGIRITELPWTQQLPFSEAADWGDVHQFLGDAIVWLAGLHAVAALYHHYVVKDGVLRSMMPGTAR